MAAVDRIDVEQPVGSDQDRGHEQHRQRLAAANRLANLAPGPGDRDEQDQHQQRPDDAVRDDVDRGDRLKPFEIDRHDAPQPVGGEAVEQAGPGAAVGGLVGKRCVHWPFA